MNEFKYDTFEAWHQEGLSRRSLGHNIVVDSMPQQLTYFFKDESDDTIHRISMYAFKIGQMNMTLEMKELSKTLSGLQSLFQQE